MRTTFLKALRTTAFGLSLLLFGLLGQGGVAPIAAQDTTTEVVDDAEAAVQTTEDEADDGDNGRWGLLGLLGLAGLAGLLRRPARAVITDPTPTRRT